MKIESLSILDFRGIRDLTLTFGDGLNVLLGVNGAGKSAVLDCAAKLLSRFIGRIRSASGTGHHFADSDINNHASFTRNNGAVSIRGKRVQWTVAKARRGHRAQASTNVAELKMFAAKLHDDLANEPSTSLPTAVHYPVNRAVLDVPLPTRKRTRFDRMAAYDGALAGDGSFRSFFEWFLDREDSKKHLHADCSERRDPQLQAVRTAVESVLPGLNDLRVERFPTRMVVSKDGEELAVIQLSQGEKCLLAMVGDLARRVAMANPHMPNPLEAEAVVLIDELALHLHPAWHRLVPTALTATFPNAQFIASTNSPTIVSLLPPERVWTLTRNEVRTVATRPGATYGQRTGRILEDIMGVPDRPQEVSDQIADLFQTIDEGRLDEAVQQRDALQCVLGGDPDIVRAGTLIHRRRVLHA